MLRLRSRAVTLMADHSSHQSSAPTQKTQNKRIPSFLGSPRLRDLFVTRAHANYYSDQSESAVTLSPTSILDAKPFSFSTPLRSPIWYDPPNKKLGTISEPSRAGHSTPTFPETKYSWESFEFSRVGLNSLIANSCTDQKSADASLINKFEFLNLKVQIPPLPNSPTEFGTKTWNSPKFHDERSSRHPRGVPAAGNLSIREMELSEDYTCVTCHGPNPTTTHIFDNCIVGSCLFSLSDNTLITSTTFKSGPESFLSSCWTCKKRLNQSQDIYIYRGDKAFCSHECRYQEMILDGAAENEEDEDSF